MTAIIPPTKLADVKDAVLSLGVEMMSIANVMVCGRRIGRFENQHTPSLDENLLNKTRLEIMVSDDMVKRVIDTVMGKVTNGSGGDGAIFVTDVPQFIRIPAEHEALEKPSGNPSGSPSGRSHSAPWKYSMSVHSC